jgi:hypothetical protein
MNDPLQQRAAQKQTGNRQAVDQLLARLKGLISSHSMRIGSRLSQPQIGAALQFAADAAIQAQHSGPSILRH